MRLSSSKGIMQMKVSEILCHELVGFVVSHQISTLMAEPLLF
jgi:hypothetical protein